MSIPAIELMTALRSGQSTSPRLTWYGPDSERVELSGRVLDNWVAKTSNLLQDELDAEPGMRLRLDLPAHWKSMILGPGRLAAGHGSGPGRGGGGPAGHRRPGAGAAAGGFDAVLAVALPALAMRWPGELPAGVLDYAAEVRSHGDVFMPHAIRNRHGRAVRRSAGQPHAHGALLDGFAAGHDAGAAAAGSGRRTAWKRPWPSPGAWKHDGSVVLVHPDVELTGQAARRRARQRQLKQRCGRPGLRAAQAWRAGQLRILDGLRLRLAPAAGLVAAWWCRSMISWSCENSGSSSSSWLNTRKR